MRFVLKKALKFLAKSQIKRRQTLFRGSGGKRYGFS